MLKNIFDRNQFLNSENNILFLETFENFLVVKFLKNTTLFYKYIQLTLVYIQLEIFFYECECHFYCLEYYYFYKNVFYSDDNVNVKVKIKIFNSKFTFVSYIFFQIAHRFVNTLCKSSKKVYIFKYEITTIKPNIEGFI